MYPVCSLAECIQRSILMFTWFYRHGTVNRGESFVNPQSDAEYTSKRSRVALWNQVSKKKTGYKIIGNKIKNKNRASAVIEPGLPE